MIHNIYIYINIILLILCIYLFKILLVIIDKHKKTIDDLKESIEQIYIIHKHNNQNLESIFNEKINIFKINQIVEIKSIVKNEINNISKDNKLVQEYKEKIDLIQSSTEDNRNQLFSILKELFIIKIVDNEQSYTINPSLTLTSTDIDIHYVLQP